MRSLLFVSCILLAQASSFLSLAHASNTVHVVGLAEWDHKKGITKPKAIEQAKLNAENEAKVRCAQPQVRRIGEWVYSDQINEKTYGIVRAETTYHCGPIAAE